MQYESNEEIYTIRGLSLLARQSEDGCGQFGRAGGGRAANTRHCASSDDLGEVVSGIKRCDGDLLSIHNHSQLQKRCSRTCEVI